MTEPMPPARHAEIEALSPSLRDDLEMLCVIASGPEVDGGITESRGREILDRSVTEFRALIRKYDPPDRAEQVGG